MNKNTRSKTRNQNK